MKTLLIILCLSVVSAAYPRPPYENPNQGEANNVMDNDVESFIDANKLLMFTSNRGALGYDISASIGKNDGLYYPYTGMTNILNGLYTRTVVYGGGLWLGGINIATGDTLVTVAEYTRDFFPGPMTGGTFDPNGMTDPSIRVYKLHKDSMASNPNQDYNEWPVDQGAPVDNLGNPLLIGDQTLWSVYNDANPAVRTNDASSLTGLGIEVQQTVWAIDQPGIISIPSVTQLATTQLGNSNVTVTVSVIEYNLLTGDTYNVILDSIGTVGAVWHLYNVTTGIYVLTDQTAPAEADGLRITVEDPLASGFTAFEVVANGGGPLDPPEPGAFAFQDFPTPGGANPTSNQQLGEGQWAFHTGDNGGTNGGGTRNDYDSFISRVLRSDNAQDIAGLDFEMRFTGSYTSPGVGGSYAIEAYEDDNVFWVPFELWMIGSGTPNDASDDVRMVVWTIDFGADDTYNLENWGTSANGGGGLEHSASTGDNDPYTDWIYWLMPVDDSPGESGYQTRVAEMQAATYDFGDEEYMARTVLINWNGGETAPFTQDIPELGTVFRITTVKEVPRDTFVFVATAPAPLSSGPEGLSIYVKYKLINKGSKSLTGMHISMWFDPDLGWASDDLVGCDTLDDLFYCYNDGPDQIYGELSPSFGGKLLEGPIVPSPGDTATVDGLPVYGCKNLDMTSFQMYINSMDPNNAQEAYRYMQGFDMFGNPLPNGSRYVFPGDPVTGTGDLDPFSSDKRLMPSFGPFDFAPGDTQQVIVRLAVGQGIDALSSITSLREILNTTPFFYTESAMAIADPDTFFVVVLDVVDPVYSDIYIGNFPGGHLASDVVMESLIINDQLTPTSATLIPSYPGLVGEVVHIQFDASDFVSGYMPLWNITTQSYNVRGAFNDGAFVTATGDFIMRSHLSGDLNLDGTVNVADLTALISLLFKGGPAPAEILVADVDGSCGEPNVSDVTYMVAYLFGGGAAPVPGCSIVQ